MLTVNAHGSESGLTEYSWKSNEPVRNKSLQMARPCDGDASGRGEAGGPAHLVLGGGWFSTTTALGWPSALALMAAHQLARTDLA